MTTEEIVNTYSFKFVPPTDDNVVKINILSTAYQDVAHALNAHLEPSREQSIALTKLQESFLIAVNYLNK